MPPVNINVPPYPYGSQKNPVNVRGSTVVSGAVATTARAPAYTPRGYSAQSNNQVQYGPAFVYDWLPWGTNGVGVTGYRFFQRAEGSSGVTKIDTNMQASGNMGAGNKFQVQKIWVGLKLGMDYVTQAADATLVSANALDDFKAIMNNGWFQMYVNNTPLLGNGISPLINMAAPPQISATGGIGTGSANAIQALAPVAVNSGYDTTMYPFALNDMLPFSANIEFPTAVTLPSGATGGTTYIGVIMYGLYGRPAS